ncbi:MAG TPA: inositol monophosphatase family protein [Acidimicrobiales bacterium]|nr:inositol monophosphatase family protein [Acidimicrobiales bacterium]
MTSGEAALQVLHDAATAVASALAGLDDWGPSGRRPDQYRSDVVADEAALAVLSAAGFGAYSEESGLHGGDRPVRVVVDPVDGSTNAARGLPWWATSLCAVDGDGPLAALVVNQATGARYSAVRGGGAYCGSDPIRPTGCTAMASAIVAFSGYPRTYLGWSQYRSLGAAALDLCAVAAGTLDAFIDCGVQSLAPWDYLGSLLICAEAGAVVTEARGRELVVTGGSERRTVVAAATPSLLAEALSARRLLDGAGK